MITNVYQLHTQGFEPRLITSLASARREAHGLAVKGYKSTIYRLTKEGAKFVASYAPRAERV